MKGAALAFVLTLAATPHLPTFATVSDSLVVAVSSCMPCSILYQKLEISEL